MALMPAPKTKPVAGLPGQFQNMEEWNAFTAFASDTATKAIGFGHPVSVNGQAGDGTATVKALADGEVFAGITRENITTGNRDDQTVYADNDVIGVADEGVIFVLAGGDVTKGQPAFFNPADNKFYGASATGYLPLPNCEFDQGGAADQAVPLRLRIVPGGTAVTAAT
ncbi:hypothetical protein JYP52_19775 [Nitratireductor aquibiodomus]|uniref:structural cement protein Gp24 n=1 Tax=Nitratireductor aquibiodomus TaxID=204799 RepID=UPI0019D3D771|nr:hypothetical protein [Nitratireductor aquibiodomus]MBN7763387.1 hypothetical protein [Nitratireductor aquibiodomus]